MRINKIATIETQNSGDFVLPFSIRGNEGAIDGDVTQEVYSPDVKWHGSS